MKKNFTLKALADLRLGFLALFLLFSASSIMAQVTCNNATVLWSEDFGTGTTASSSPDILTSGLTYQETGNLTSEGTYRVINNTQQKPEWLNSTDHSGNTNGKMLVVNGEAETFFQHTITNTHGFTPGSYSVSLFLMNVDSTGICSPNPLLPIATITVEYLSESNTWISLSGSPYTAAPIQLNNTPTWINQGSGFTLPATGAFFPTQIRITLGDGTVGGCGNDFAIDDISFALCPEGAPMPVELTTFTARQKENAVSLNWSTSQEINNKYFQVERSADGNSNWTVLTTVNGAGNSQVINNYNAIDASPISGVNFYRLKQVDYDGNYKFSKIINVRVNGQKTSISVLSNPFHNTLSVNFVSAAPQQVFARLFDVTGQQVAIEKWSVTSGNIRKDFSGVSNLQHGMYILTIRNNSGEILYNGKVVKQ
jgi:hypothetical protein